MTQVTRHFIGPNWGNYFDRNGDYIILQRDNLYQTDWFFIHNKDGDTVAFVCVATKSWYISNNRNSILFKTFTLLTESEMLAWITESETYPEDEEFEGEGDLIEGDDLVGGDE